MKHESLMRSHFRNRCSAFLPDRGLAVFIPFLIHFAHLVAALGVLLRASGVIHLGAEKLHPTTGNPGVG